MDSKRVRIGSRSVEFKYCATDDSGRVHRIYAVWSPSKPSRWKSGQLEQYRKARDHFLAEVNAAIGVKPISIDAIDPAGVDIAGLRQAGEVLLAARAAGITCCTDAGEIRCHGDPALLSIWEPCLRPHSAGIVALLAAQRQAA
jgi:hypothetical protein